MSELLFQGAEQKKVWEVATGKTARQLPQCPNFVNRIAFSPDEKYLASVSFNILSKDRSAKLWEVPAGRCVWTGQEHTAGVGSLAFSADGVEQFLSAERGGRLLSPAGIKSGFRRDTKVLAALGRVRPAAAPAAAPGRSTTRWRTPGPWTGSPSR